MYCFTTMIIWFNNKKSSFSRDEIICLHWKVVQFIMFLLLPRLIRAFQSVFISKSQKSMNLSPTRLRQCDKKMFQLLNCSLANFLPRKFFLFCLFSLCSLVGHGAKRIILPIDWARFFSSPYTPLGSFFIGYFLMIDSKWARSFETTSILRNCSTVFPS